MEFLTIEIDRIPATTRNAKQSISIAVSQKARILGWNLLDTKVSLMCSSLWNVMDMPMKTIQDRHTSVISYCHATGLLNAKRLMTDHVIRRIRNIIMATVIADAMLLITSQILSNFFISVIPLLIIRGPGKLLLPGPDKVFF
jgi:hypothetical protein